MSHRRWNRRMESSKQHKKFDFQFQLPIANFPSFCGRASQTLDKQLALGNWQLKMNLTRLQFSIPCHQP
jgi:hypothetical protein